MIEATEVRAHNPFLEEADTEMWDLSGERQYAVREAVGNLLITMIEENGEPYSSEFVVVLNTGQRVAFECLLSEETCNTHIMN